MPQVLMRLLHDLGWAAPMLATLAAAGALGLRAGRAWAAVILPVGAGFLSVNAMVKLQRIPQDTTPDLYSGLLARGLSGTLAIPVFAGAAAALLLPACRGGGRDRGTVAVAVAGALWPLISLIPRATGGSQPEPLMAAAFMALAGALLTRPAREGRPPLAARAAYASVATLVGAAAVPSTFIRGFINVAFIDPWTVCSEHRESVERGAWCAALAMAGALLATLPLRAEARRLGSRRWASSFARAMVVSATALSPMNTMIFTLFGPKGPCPPVTYAEVEVGLVPEAGPDALSR